MTDASTDLRDTLARLHDQLRDTQNVSDETRRLLLGVIDEIRAVTGEEPAAAPLATTSEDGTLIARLKAAEASFGAEHPTIAHVIGGLIDILGQMGI